MFFNAKKSIFFVACLTACVSLFAFSKHEYVVESPEVSAEEIPVKIGVLSGPSGIPSAYLMENAADSESFEIFAGAALLLPKLINGEIDIGFLPPNVAAKVHNANGGSVVLAAVAGNGMMSLITKDKNVHSISDLAGKTVSVAGQGATPDYMMRYLLSANGINAELDFSIPNAQIAPSLLSDKIEYAVVPEPFATVALMKDENVLRAVDIQSAFAEASGTDGIFPMTVIVVRTDFAKKHTDTVRDFLSKYEKAAEWTQQNPNLAGDLVEKHGIGLSGAVSAAAIPNCAYTFKNAQNAKADVEKILKIFLDFDSASIGGKLPDDNFYFKGL